jgi:2-desacetyl-2-hydroxyethyl bacteriochlorophyllide A dehydrogenase
MSATQETILPGQMQAIVYDDYGSTEVLHPSLRSLPRRLPGQVLIEVVAASVNPVDCRLRGGLLRGLLPGGFPRIPGYDVAGVVVEAGDDMRFRVADRVMAFLDNRRGGGYAQYAVCAVDAVAKIPDEMPFDVAAAIPLAGTTALQALRDHGKMKPRQRILVNGASGGVGMFAVQIAVAAGCQVDAVASGAHREFCLQLGAEEFYDYEQVDFTRLGLTWDIIFDAAGKSGFMQARRALKKHGRYVTTEPDLKGLAMTFLTWPLSKTGKTMLAKPKGDDLRSLIEMYRAGNLKVSIDRHYGLAEAAQAQRRVEEGVDQGKVVIMCRDSAA